MRAVVAVVAIFALVCGHLPATAQPVDLPPEARAGGSGSGGTRIPVSMPDETEVLKAENAGSSAGAAPVSVEEPLNPETYTCGPGDVFELNFWGQQNFRLRIAADLEGRAFISKVGFVSVSGKSLASVRKEVHKKVRGNYPGLNFELTLVSPRSFQVHIVDNVAKPGNYVAHPLERVSSVLTRAGGITGSKRRITIRHKNGTTGAADLLLYEQTGDTARNPFLLDGDVITVPFPAVTVTVTGAVNRPGSYELVASKDLAELIALAGGLASNAARSLPIRIIKKDKDQRSVLTEVSHGETLPHHALQDKDHIEVRSTDEFQRSVLVVGAIVGADALDTATAGLRLPYVEGDTVLSLVNRAGGIKAPGDLRGAYISRSVPDGPPLLIAIDLEALLVRRDFTADKRIELNDTIVIPPKQYSVLVEGAVGRAGLYPYNPQFGVPEYIAHAGGRTRTARDLDEVSVIDWGGKTRDYRRGMKLAPGDSILVPERNFSRAEVVQLILASAGVLLSGVAIMLAARQ